MGLLCGVAAAGHRRAVEGLERDLLFRCSEEGSAPRVVARVLTGASEDLKAAIRPDLIEEGPVRLHDLLPQGARADKGGGFDGRRGETR